MAIVRTATPQLYVSPFCCVTLGVCSARNRVIPLSYALLLRSNVTILFSRVVLSMGRGSESWDCGGSMVWVFG